jgi:hypothetical protein
LSYRTAVRVLLALAVDPDSIAHIGEAADPMRHVLRVAAEACRRIDQEQADRKAALLYAAELRAVLMLAADVLEALPLPIEGSTRDGYMLAQQARRLVQREPLESASIERSFDYDRRHPVVARTEAAD